MCQNVYIYGGPGAGRFGSAPMLTPMSRGGSPGIGAVSVERKCSVMKKSASGAQRNPCLLCTRVPDPDCCNDKNCRLWQDWFVARWDAMRHAHREAMEMVHLEPVGVALGGRVYAHPQAAKAYLAADPCASCLCPRDLCSVPCRVRQHWEKAREVVQ